MTAQDKAQWAVSVTESFHACRVVFMPLDPAWPTPIMEGAMKKCSMVLYADPLYEGMHRHMITCKVSVRLQLQCHERGHAVRAMPCVWCGFCL